MAWHYIHPRDFEQCTSSPERVGESWPIYSSDTLPDAPSRLKSIREKFSLRGKPTDVSRGSPSGMISKPSTENHGAEKSTSLREDSPVKTSAPPEKARESRAKDPASGQKWPASFAKYDPGSHSWKTPQLSLFGGLELFLETWPKWGMMQGGECSALAMLAHDTGVRGCGSLPTPQKSDVFPTSANCNFEQRRRQYNMLSQGEKIVGSIYPHPVFYERLMLWPMAWTALQPLETAKFHKWRRSHGEF